MNLLIHLILALPFVGAYAMFAVGIVVIYRASRVLNLAHGAMALVPAYITYSVSEAGLPMPVAFTAGVGSGVLLGLVIERIFIRGMRHMSLSAQTVGTVGVLSLLIALVAVIWGTVPISAPQIFPSGFIPVGEGRLLYGAIGLFVVAVVLAVAMLALFKFTNLGLAMRGSAENRRAASLMGINPEQTTAIAWAIGGGLAAVSGILLAAITILTPYDLPLQTLPAFVAALLGGIDSVLGALVGSAAVGSLFGIVPATSSLPLIGVVTSQTGGPEFALTIVALVVMYLRGQRFSVAIREDSGFAAPATTAHKRRRRLPLPLTILGFAALVGWVWLPGISFSILANVSQAMVFMLVAISLVILTGWVGQISLGHAALVGVAGFGTGILANKLGLDFPFNLPFAAALSAAVAVLLGAIALRVRGLYLAVATLIFSWMADSFLFRASWFVGAGGSATVENVTFGTRDGFPFFDFSNRKVLYYFGLAITIVAILAASNIKNSKTGRAFFAVRGSEMAAASLGVDVMRYKLLAFGLSGMLAGAAGNLIMLDQRTIVPDQFRFTFSLFYLSIVVVGGTTSLVGITFASLLFAGLNVLFENVEALGGYLELVSAGLLVAAILIQAHSRRFAKLRSLISQRLEGVLEAAKLSRPAKPEPPAASEGDIVVWAKRLVTSMNGARAEGQLHVVMPPEEGRSSLATAGRWREFVPVLRKKREFETATAPPSEPEPAVAVGSSRPDTPVVLEGRSVTVRFGGLVAVDSASIQVRQGEIVGLIGPNGAGKTTLFNALSGLNEPTGGRIVMFGREVSSAPVHERARLGLGRTFQVLQLFSDLSVRENLMVATHIHNETGFVRHTLATDAAIRAERECAERVQEVIDILELWEIADRPVAGLPFGLLRLVELGRAVVTESPIVLLDEAASGLDNTETDRFTDFLKSLRTRLGLSMLLIEHDVRMVTGVSDYMYVLNMGRIISEGPPDVIQRDPHVIAAYLGEEDQEEEAGTVVTGSSR